MTKKITFDVSALVMAALTTATTLQQLCGEAGGSTSIQGIALLEVNPIKAWAMLNGWEVTQREYERETTYNSGVLEPYISLSLQKGMFDVHFYTVSFQRD